MAPPDSDRSTDLQALVRAMRPEIVELLTAHRVPEERAAEILHDTLVALAVRWHRVADPRAWIVNTVEARCRAWAEGAGRGAGPAPEPPRDEPDGGGS